jgi:class I fructose-bisphosphate aldolase
MDISRIATLLGDEAESLLSHKAIVPADGLHLPGPDYIERVFSATDRKPTVLVNLQRMFDHGRLGGSGYLSILPVDQGIEHSASASFAPNPPMFDPEHVVRLAIEGGCNAVASTYGTLRSVARKYAHRIPFVAKINHNEILSYPNMFDQTMFGSVRQAFDMGAAGIGATVYWGSDVSRRELQEVQAAFEEAHSLGMFTILWCYLRNPAFSKGTTADHHTAADLTSQAIHLGVTIGADIIKQKAPTHPNGYQDPALVKFGKTHKAVYDKLLTSHEIDMIRYQVMNAYMGRAGVINSGGEAGQNDLAAAVRIAVVNKRAGGMGLILGRKAFQRPLAEGIEILNAVQDVYLSRDVTIA